MNDDKNAKKGLVDEVTLDMIKRKLITHWKIILGGLLVAIVLLNTFQGMVDSRVYRARRAVTAEVEALRTEIGTLGAEIRSLSTELASFDTRLSEAEMGVGLETEIGALRTEKGVLGTDIGTLRTEFAGFGARLSELEKGVTVDHDALKEDIAAIRKAGEAFEKKLSAVIKAEEEKLALLEKDVVNQRTHVDALRRLLQ